MRKSEMGLAAAAVILSVVGLLDSLYFTLVYYGRMRAHSRLVPEFCHTDGGTCQAVIATPEAKALSVPNSTLGLAYYAITLAAGLFRLLLGSWPVVQVFAAVSAAVFLFSLYLAWKLIFRLRTSCPLCFLAHTINLALAAIFISAAYGIEAA